MKVDVHLITLNGSCQALAQPATLNSWVWRLLLLNSQEIGPERIASSANSQTNVLEQFKAFGRLLIYIRKSSGPSTDPWGIHIGRLRKTTFQSDPEWLGKN